MLKDLSSEQSKYSHLKSEDKIEANKKLYKCKRGICKPDLPPVSCV